MNAAREGFTHRLVAAEDEPVRRYFTHAIREGAPLALTFGFTMSGRIKVGPLWLPFTAQQESGQQAFAWTARVGVGGCTPLVVTDRYDADGGLTAGRLLGRRTLFRTTGGDTTRSAAGRAALEACAFAAPALLPHLGVVWSAESDELIIARWQVGTEAVTVPSACTQAAPSARSAPSVGDGSAPLATSTSRAGASSPTSGVSATSPSPPG